MKDEIIEFAYQLFLRDIITLEEYNKIAETVIYDNLSDIERLIEE